MKKRYTLAALLFLSVLQGYHAFADSVSLGNTVTVAQIPHQSGAVLISGNFTKPLTTGDITLTIKYKDTANNWVAVWCKAFPAGDQYDEQLNAAFELPASALSAYNIRVELSAATTLNNSSSVTWQNVVNHYRQGDYTVGVCDLDESQYTILFTPRKSGTVTYTNGNVSGIKDRVNGSHLYKKLHNIVLSVNGNGVIDSTDTNAPYISLSTTNSAADIVSSQKYIYQGSDSSPFEFSYHDPVFLFAGKFPNTGFFINFSNWYLPASEGGEGWGRGYLDFTNPDSLLNRYYTLHNYIEEHLPDVIANQEPVVIALSKITGFRIYKADGTYVSLHSVNNYGNYNTFGYPKLWEKFRGPGSENFSLKGVSAASLYGIGAVRNHLVNGQPRPLPEVELEIKKFINYVGIFGDTSSYALTGACANACVTVNPGAEPDFTPTDWTLAPNSYIFTGKDTSGADVGGLYIPVKKAYAMWADSSNAEFSLKAPISSGSLTTAYVYWEDVSGLVKSAGNYKLDLVGSGEDAKIKVMIDKAKGKGNAVVSFHVGPNGNNTDPVAWSWHVWVTDDVDTNGSTYRQGFETDRNNVPFSQLTNRDGSPYEFQWMNRNLGATNAEFLGHDWNKSAGLMYQWGRKDPLPPMKYKDGTGYEISGAAGTFLARQFTQNTTSPFGWMMRPYNDAANHTEIAQNIAYSIKNPLKAITFQARYGHWFSDQYYKVASSNIYDIVNWDLWSDNRNGKASKVYTADVDMARDTKSYELKSAYDPCPCNWRIPSHYGSIVSGEQANLSSPWGRNASWYNDDVSDSSIFYLNQSTHYLEQVKVYPSIGFDFRAQKDTGDYRRNRNLGIFPITGAYVFMGAERTQRL